MRTYHRHLLGGGGADAIADAGLLVLRLFAGLALAFAHGLGKLPPSEGFVGTVAGMGFPAPELFAWLAGFAEFGGGLLLAAGLLTRPAAVVIAINMAVAAFIRHAGDPFAGKELALMFFFVAVLFAFTGPGRFSADALLFGRHATRSLGRHTRV
jgi:putative oxidoreductase